MTVETEEIFLPGPDGSNPLGLLCAVGTLRVASLVWKKRSVRMAWTRWASGWRPLLFMEPMLDEGEFIEGMHSYLRHGPNGRDVGASREAGKERESSSPEDAFPYFAFNNNTSKIEPQDFRSLAFSATAIAARRRRSFADFLAAFGCEVCGDEGYIADTAFRTMSGSGHQHFLGTMLNLVRKVEPNHVRSALLESWRYTDPLKKLSMRWDPHDEKRYALQWKNPSKDTTRGKRGSVLGANRIAIEALPLFPTVPRGRAVGRPRLETTGFDSRISEPFWRWPIWSAPITADICRSLLAHPALQKLQSDSAEALHRDLREKLRRMGVDEVFQSRRITVDYYRNFTPARAI